MSVLVVTRTLSSSFTAGASFPSRQEASDIPDTGNLVGILSRAKWVARERDRANPCTNCDQRRVRAHRELKPTAFSHIHGNLPTYIRNIALIQLLILISQTSYARHCDKFVPRENNWQQLGYVRAAALRLSRVRQSPSAGRCVLIPHTPAFSGSRSLYEPGDFVNASMHTYFMARLSRPLSPVPQRRCARGTIAGTRDTDIFTGWIPFENT